MKYSAMALFTNLASILCICAGFYLLMSGKEGWGWFLFVAVLLHTTVKFKSD